MLCVLPVETVVRDFDARLYLAYELLQKGHTCVIGEKKGVHDYMFQQREPYIYLAKGISKNIYKKIKKTGGAFVILDEEGGIYNKSMYSFFSRSDDVILKEVDLYCAWGKTIKEYLLTQRKNIREEDIVITGNPRFDLCKTEFKDFHRTLLSGSKRAKGKYFLVNTDFAIVNHQLGRKGRVEFNKTVTTLADYDKEVGGNYFDPEKIAREEAYQEGIYTHFLKLIESISLKFPDWNVVVRPHPVEDIQTYRRYFTHYKNVHVIRDGAVHGWIVDAAVVIHHDCTTGIEAMLFGKPTLSYCPDLDEDLVQWLPVKAGFKVMSQEKMLVLLEDHVVNKYTQEFFTSQYNYDLIEKFIANVKINSAKTIVDSIETRKGDWYQRGNAVLKELLSTGESTIRKPSMVLRVKNKICSLVALAYYLPKIDLAISKS